MLKVLDLFSGIGGFSLGLQATNEFETIAFCEIDPFCQKVLKKHWPNVPIFNDITKLGEGELNGLGKVDVICGGFPCQDISCAGKGAGIHAARSGLWWEMLRIIRLVRPRYVLAENVSALLIRGIDEVLGSLSEIGYNAEWQILRASNLGLPHERERVFIIAYPKGKRLDEDVFSQRIYKESNRQGQWGHFPSIYLPVFGRSYPEISRLIRGDNGLSPRLDGCIDSKKGPVDKIQSRVKALGNSIAPRMATYIAECVLEYDAKMKQ